MSAPRRGGGQKRYGAAAPESALRAALGGLTESGRAALEKAIQPDARGLAGLARAMAKPGWARGAVDRLTTRTRAALRILVRASDGVSPTELDAIVRAVPSDDDGPESPAELLVGRGVATIAVERVVTHRDERRLFVLGPLRERLDRLLSDESPPCPPLPSVEADVFAAARFELQVGVLMAVVDQVRPRVTRFMDLHRADGRAIVEQLTTLFGDHDEAARRLHQTARSGLLFIEDGRLRAERADLSRWRSPATAMLLARFEAHRSSTLFRVLVGALLAQDGWVPDTTLVRVGGLAALSSSGGRDCLRRLREELAELTRLPGIDSARHGAHAFWRLRPQARRALEGGALEAVSRVGCLLVQPNFEIIASPGAPLATLARLGRLCRLVSADQVAVFALDEATIRRSAAEGVEPSEMLGLLEREASHGVPATVARAISEWAHARGHVRLTVGTVLQTDLPIEEVRRLGGIRGPIHQLAPGWLATDSGSALVLSTALRKAGVVVRPFDPDPDDGEEDDESAHSDGGDGGGPSASRPEARSGQSSLADVLRHEVLALVKIPSPDAR